MNTVTHKARSVKQAKKKLPAVNAPMAVALGLSTDRAREIAGDIRDDVDEILARVRTIENNGSDELLEPIRELLGAIVFRAMNIGSLCVDLRWEACEYEHTPVTEGEAS